MLLVCRQAIDEETRQESETAPGEEKVVVCRLCSNVVTRPAHQTTVDSAFSHTFANPHGHVFEIGCFTRAEGCVSVSRPSSEFTWFPGYSWEIGACSVCGAHIGWKFSRINPPPSSPGLFYGLILDKLIFP
ncbi:cereblon family protein [Desulfospira joergensenii]|uniref:cereblon family protein n=1 Tax=Desulfospira joergensenii TaxID=53329 RepID=UPI0003B4BBAF|nr:cereblon family protein [Desulfospira joergensenii]